jgi:hypothetical protein
MPGIQRTTLVALLLLVSSAAFASAVDAQIFDRLTKRAQRAAESELLSEVDRLVRDGELVIAILANQRRSSTSTDDDGNPIGHPVEALATRMAAAIFSPP